MTHQADSKTLSGVLEVLSENGFEGMVLAPLSVSSDQSRMVARDTC
jgi:hypothetical protein